MSTRDLSGNGRSKLPSKNVLNTTLVTQVEVIENGVVKYYNWNGNGKVYAMMEDTHKTLRIYINNKIHRRTRKKQCRKKTENDG